MDTMKRKCVVCGKELEITMNKDKTYSGGHFFDYRGLDGEYWECDACYEKWPK